MEPYFYFMRLAYMTKTKTFVPIATRAEQNGGQGRGHNLL